MKTSRRVVENLAPTVLPPPDRPRRRGRSQGTKITMHDHRQKETLITLRNAGMRSGGRVLVEGVDLTIARGEIVTLIGPNGSGKSTTAKMVTGVLKPSTGSVSRMAGLTVGYVPQKLAIDWTLPLTV